MPRVGLLLLLFFAGLLPFTANYVVHHPDERYYTDAAILMRESGDYIIPRHPDGSPRFEKPILTYWLVAASYALLGVSPLSSRLPFLLAGCGVLWLTYRLAMLLFERRRVAQLAVVIMLCHPLLVLSATRSMPDILLCLFLLLSASGFLGLLVEQQPRRSLYAAAYIGAGLAVATKGLPVLLLVAFSWAFAQLNPWRPVSWRRLVHLPSMAVGVLVAVGWFLVLLALHREVVLSVFWWDQVTSRLVVDYWKLPLNLALAVGLFGLTLLPWSLPLLTLGMRRAIDWQTMRCKEHQARAFILLWALLIALLMSVTVKFSSRYVLMASPLLAVLLADALDRADVATLRLWLRGMLATVLGVLVLIAAGVGLMAFQLGDIWLDGAAVALFLIICVGLAMVGMRGHHFATASCLGVAQFLLLPLSFLAARHLVLPEQGAQITGNLARLGLLGQRSISFIGSPSMASKVRVCSGGLARLSPLVPEMASARPITIIAAREAESLDLNGCRVRTVSEGFRALPIAEVARALGSGTLKDYLARHREEFQLVIPSAPATP